MGNRNNNGSLFHQLINAPGLMERQDLSQPVSFQTRENYFNWCHKAAAVFKSYGIRNLSEIGKDEIQRYENQLETEGKSASTIHNYLVPICKATGIAIKDIRKPIRASSEFKRSAGKGRGDGGKPAELNKFLGLREGDLKRLRGDSLIYKNGHCYVIVDKGKGGKYQEQRVCDKDVADVQKFFDGSRRKLFIAGDFGRNFDYHGQRREYAMNICAYYTEQAKDPKFRKELYKEIATQWHQLNKKHRGHLEPLSFFDKPYVLRGKNKDLAIKQGRPWILDRLALRATSVLHLAHWRDNVTVQSYLARR